jgi:hypothetical protein
MVSKNTTKLIEENTKDLEQINTQRRAWLYASSVVVVSAMFLIFGWDWLDNFHSKSVWWVTVSAIIILSVNWWYWTMRVMLRLLHHQKMEFHIITELIVEIKDIKNEVKQLANQEVDNKK